MRYICLLGSFLMAVAIVAQPSRTDSLAQLVRTAVEDTSKIYLYYDYGFALEASNLDSAAMFYIKARDLAVRLHHRIGQLKFAGNYSAVLNEKGKFEESYRVNRNGRELARSFGATREEGIACVNIANVFNYQGRFDSAIAYYLQGAALLEKAGATNMLHVLYQNIGIVFDGIKQYDKAIEYAERSIALSRKNGDDFTLSAVLNNKATSMQAQRRYAEALPILFESVQVSQRSGNPQNELSSYINIGGINIKLKRADTALRYFRLAQQMAKQSGRQQQEGLAWSGMANAESSRGNYAIANTYIDKALALSEPAGSVAADMVDEYKLAADIKAHLGAFEPAYTYLQRYLALNDSLTNADVAGRVGELEKKYESVQKDKALLDGKLQLAESRADARSKQLWLAIAIACLALLGGLFAASWRSYRHRQKLSRERIRSLQQEADVIRLKATLEGQAEERQRIAQEMHDEIGSGLTSIIFLSEGVGRDPQGGTRISALARQIVGQMNEIVWSLSSGQDKLEELVAFIRHNVSGMLEAASLEYEFCIPDDIPDIPVSGVQRRHIYLAVKEAVHNSIKHAGATSVTIRMDFSDGIAVQIEDNGKGMPQEVVRRFGNGLRNMRHRMETTGGSFTLMREQPVSVRLHLPADRIL